MEPHVQRTWLLLKIVFGVVPIVAGLDKFLGLLANWEAYLSPLVSSLLPISPHLFMRLAGLVEIAAGLLVLSRYTRVGAYVVAAWLAAIALQLATTRILLDVAVRDLVMAVGAFSLGQLSAAREALGVGRRVRETGTAIPPARAAASPTRA